jgi:pimeloyl-ACP methyl ester carboxylesterase
MTRVGRYDNPYLSVEFTGDPPAGTTVEALGLVSQDRAHSHGFLWLPPGPCPSTVLALMHPRADFTRHYAVPHLLAAGYAVLTQNSRTVGNDSMLIHEQILLDVAAGVRTLRERGFRTVILVGNSGGGSLYTMYLSQAHTPAGVRLTDTAAGDPFDLNRFDLPRVDGIVYLAAHPGEGLFLLHAVDPSVTDEDDPVACDPALDMYNPANGFREPPAESRYDAAFLQRYRAAQRARVERIDARARALVAVRRAARARVGENVKDVAAWRQAIAVKFMTVYRTEADPRYTDLSLDPSDRDYGSIFGYRADLINYGPFGFARVVTPEAWLSTWSGLSSRAAIPTNGPRVDVPALVVQYSADNSCFTSDARQIHDSLATTQKAFVSVPGDHYGFAAPGSKTSGRDLALPKVIEWLKGNGW